MKIRHIFLAILFLFMMAGCEGEITGIVVDAETGQPIEGAVVLVNWSKTYGLGLTYSKTHEVFEALTDKDGKVTISGVYDPLVNPPSLTVYKKGYVAWNNEFIFPEWKRRTDFKWVNNYVFKLEKFKTEYSYDKHTDFIASSIRVGASEKKQKMFNAIRWEQLKASEERSEKGRKNEQIIN